MKTSSAARLRLFFTLLCTLLAAALLAAALFPPRYLAVARILLPKQGAEVGALVVKAATYDMHVQGERGSRVLSIIHIAADPREAAAAVNGFLRTQLGSEMTVIDEADVPFAPVGPGAQARAVLGGAGLLLLLFPFSFFKARNRSEAQDRLVVRQALRFAQLGQKTLLVDTGSKFRLVLSTDIALALRPRLRILARLAGGALVVARRRR